MAKLMDLPGLIKKAIDQIFNRGKVRSSEYRQLIQQTYQPLKQAVNEGFGLKVEFGTPNYEFLKQLQYNTATYAAFKNHARLKEITELLVDENGNRRTKEDFRKKALEIDSKYNTHYLDVEYDTAVRQARTAAQWQKALRTKHLFPNIRYLPSVSANKREDHQTYYGIVRPIEDPVWNSILPPNGWGCKCSWEVTDDNATEVPDDMEPPQKGFEFNAGKTGTIFRLDGSDYARQVPQATKAQLIKHAKAIVDYDMAADLPYINVYSSKSGTEVLAHPLAFSQADFQQNLSAARKLANAPKIQTQKIEILPELKPDVAHQAKYRPQLLQGVKNNHNPDYRIDGKYIDLKIPRGDMAASNTIQNIISKANRQADGIVLIIDKENYISEDMLIHSIFLKYIHQAYQSFQLCLYYKGQWRIFNRESFLKFYKK